MDKRIFIAAGLLSAAAGSLALGLRPAMGQATRRTLAAQIKGKDEIFTIAPALKGGSLIYQKTVLVPGHDNVLLFEVSGQGDSHHGVALQLQCLIDGKPCTPDFGGPAAAAPPGWITPHKLFNIDADYILPDGVTLTNVGDGGGGTGDEHDNTVQHEWCIPVSTAKLHTVPLLRGNSCGEPLTPKCADGNGTVFMENVNFIIDSTFLPRGG